MFKTLCSFLRSLINKILQWLGLGSPQKAVEFKLRVHIKSACGKSVLVDLNPKWTIGQVKKFVAPKINMPPEQFSIIFAGKDLSDSIVIEECDLGQNSFLHAVKLKAVPKDHLKRKDEKRTVSPQSPGICKPLCETLLDLQLSENEREELLASLVCDAVEYQRKKAHFYVYCDSPCKSVQTGKLRVRCSLCKNGAFTVDRDPCCWEDVLKANQVSGVCQDEVCDNPWAEFFFKCTNHVSRGEADSAVALYLIKPNIKDVPCLACTDVCNPVLVFPCTNGHVTCLDCFRQYCESRLNERGFVQDPILGSTLACPAGCENSFIEEPGHFRLLGDEQYARYLRFAAEEYVLKAGGVLCPQPGCGMGLLPDPTCRRVQCLAGCGFVFCRECLQGYHIGECSSGESVPTSVPSSNVYTVNPANASQARWDADSRTTIRVISKPCPMCRTPTERDGGCMHMVCTRPQCGFHWCWVCQTEWTRECMGSHWFG